MGADSKIEWTNHTFNPWLGCEKVSAGCANCYAEALMDKRYGKVQWGKHGTRKRTSAAYWRQPLKWNREARDSGERKRVFCASLADVFEDRDDLEPWRRELFNLIYECRDLDWLVLTKRPAFARIFMEGTSGCGGDAWRENFPHVWLGTSCEDQDAADRRIKELESCPAQLLFLSCEPLIGPIALNSDRVDWVIVGGESGVGARPCELRWIRNLLKQCQRSGVPAFIKQLGRHVHMHSPGGQLTSWFPNDSKGGDMSEWPEDLRVREFPMQEVQS